jgi:hypothetical protein
MHTAAFAWYLDGAGLVVFGRDGADCFLEDAPSEVANAVEIISQPGAEPVPVRDGYDSPDFQLIVRADGTQGQARQGYERICGLRDALCGLHNITLAEGTPDEVRVISVIAKTAAPVSLGKDSGGHHRWSVAFRTEIRHVTPLRV